PRVGYATENRPLEVVADAGSDRLDVVGALIASRDTRVGVRGETCLERITHERVGTDQIQRQTWREPPLETEVDFRSEVPIVAAEVARRDTRGYRLRARRRRIDFLVRPVRRHGRTHRERRCHV